VLYAVVLSASTQFVGAIPVIYFAPTIFKTAGVSDPYLANIAVAGWTIIVTIISVVLVSKFGEHRRWLMISGTAIIAISLIVIGFGFYFATGVAQIGVIGTAIATFLFGLSVTSSLFWILITDLFPDDLKGPSSSFGNVMIYLFQLILSVTFPTILASIGAEKVYGLFWAYGGIAVICLICLCFMPLAPTKKN